MTSDGEYKKGQAVKVTIVLHGTIAQDTPRNHLVPVLTNPMSSQPTYYVPSMVDVA